MVNNLLKPLFLVAAMGLGLSNVSMASTLNVFACEAEWAALTQTLGGKHVDVYVATSAMQDVHTIAARPSLIAKMRRADLLVCTGAGLEAGWLPQVQRQGGNSKVQSGNGVFFASDHTHLLDKPQVLDRANGDVHPEGNPHVQFDPQRMLEIANALAERLVLLDPENRQHYQDNLTQFQQAWQQAIVRWQQQAKPLAGKNVVVQHATFLYLLNWLGMNAVATMEPKPGLPPTTAHLQQVLKTIEQQPVSAVLSATYQEARPSKWLNERTQIPMVRLPQSVGGNDASTDLISWYDNVIEQLLAVIK